MTKTQPLPAFDLDSFTPYRLAVAAKRTSEELARQYRARFGISIHDWRVLVHLAHAGDGVSVRDIEARVALEKYEVSRTVKRLETAGLVVKSANVTDRRLVCVALTDKGRDMMAELLPIARAYQQEIEARLGAAFDGLEAGLDRLLSETE
ncbi:MarR family transcriptional regulator [Roseovarius salis]|uniref:MarR family winged helix-turn-helix transcriptional regulator n=1 Tax=Roseovarius salis TaxID=3376063 RepID=UPI0037CC76F6